MRRSAGEVFLARQPSRFSMANSLKWGFAIRVGGRVPLVGITHDPDAATKSVFDHCLGKEFIITEITENGDAELQVEAVTGTSGDKIYAPLHFPNIISR